MTYQTDKLAGKFIVLDGPDGAGKTTQLELLAKRLEADGLTVCRLREPGGTAVGEQIRKILLSHDSGPMDPSCEMLLFMASRAQLVAERIRPAVECGQVVLCDRFVSATVAYQGASGVPPSQIIKTWEIVGGSFWPDLTIVLDLPPETGMRRIGERNGAAPAGEAGRPVRSDRMEHRPHSYHKRVREMFAALGDCYPAPVRYVQADRPIDAVAADVAAALGEAFG